MNKFSVFYIFFLIAVSCILTANKNLSKVKKSIKSSKIVAQTQSTKKLRKVTENSKSKSKLIKKLGVRYINQTNAAPVDLSLWVNCGTESQTCHFPGTTIVRYGANDTYFYKEATNDIYCSYTIYGDPLWGTNKACDYKNNSYSWTYCAGEDGACTFSGTTIVKYGADSRWAYQKHTNTINCSYTVFGDPAYGTHKNCYYLVDDLWTHCASENGTCNFEGTSLVKYGAENQNWFYKEEIDGIDCNNSVWGDPIYGTYKECKVLQGAYFWVECGKENDTCNVPGTAIVRYGNNTTFVYKEVTNSINCSYTIFTDPLYGVVKKCEYAVYNTANEPSDLQDLDDSVLTDPLDEDTAEEQASCGSDSGFGFSGMCLNQPFTNAQNGVPSDTQSTLQFLFSLTYVMAVPFDFCMGDYSGETLSSSNTLAMNNCDSIPLMDDFNYGTIAGHVYNVPCGATPVYVAFCAVFDRCGTVAISTNAGLLQCAATYSTGLAAILSPVSDMLDFVGIGFSYKRRFTADFTIAYNDNGNVKVDEITTYGHFYIALGLEFPLENVKIGGKSLKDLLSLNIEGTLFIDFGNSISTISNIINEIKSANSNTGKQILQTLMSNNAEITFLISGTFTINLNVMSRGFLPNLSFNLANNNFLVTNGNGGASGMNRGVYVYFQRGLNNLSDVFKIIVDQFKNIFSVFGVSIPTPSLDISFGLGLFVTDDSVGMSLKGPGFEINCMYIYSSEKGGCDFNNQFFTALIEGVKWVIKHARQFLDDTGAEVVSFANDVGDFATNSANATANFFTGDFRNFFERDVKNAFVSAGGEIGEFFKNDVGGGLSTAGNAIVSTGSTVVDTVSDWGNTAGDWLSDNIW